jgi:feruloyl-CoA synthase
MPGVDLRVVRADGSDAVRGETGEIWMRTDSMMSGYLNDKDATNAAFENGNWYRTGDVARLDDDGYLFIVDRLKDMIITVGENVYSKEIEDVLSGTRRSLRLPSMVSRTAIGVRRWSLRSYRRSVMF